MTAPTVSGTYATTSPWDWYTFFDSWSTSRAYAAWALDLQDASSLISASLVIYRTAGSGFPDLRVAVAPVTHPPANPGSLWASMQAAGGVDTSQTPRDVTARVAAVLDHPDWVPGRLFAVMVDTVSPGASFTASLTITIADPAQGTGTLTYTLYASAAGSTPARATGEATYTMTGTATGYRPPTEDRAATASLVYELDIDATSARPSCASGALTYELSINAASIAAAPPPPPPWRDAITSPEYQAAITARTITSDARVDILDPSGAVIAQLGGPDATHGGIISGNVTVADGRDVWWDCDLAIDQAALMPTRVGDLLHPLSHNRLRVWWRILIGPGRWVEIPVGVYYPDWPSVSVASSDATVSVTVRGQDVTWLISQAQMQGSSSVGGLTIDAAIRTVLAEVAPWAPLALAPTGRRLPAGFEAGEPGADPWQVCRDMASSAGLELRVTREGTIELAAAPSPSAPAVASFVEGVDCLAISASTSVPVGSVANRVRVECTPRRDPDGQEEIEPFTVTVTDDDPTSPLWIGHGYRYDKSVRTDTCTTVEQARAMGEGLLRASQALSETGEIVIFPHPHLDVGDVINTSIPTVGMVGARQIRGWSLALGSLGGQRVTTTGRRQW